MNEKNIFYSRFDPFSTPRFAFMILYPLIVKWVFPNSELYAYFVSIMTILAFLFISIDGYLSSINKEIVSLMTKLDYIRMHLRVICWYKHKNDVN